MNKKNNIERLFQEKFKDFEATPSEQVWENIAAELEKKENKKRVIPFWINMKAAGIAAALILGMFTANNFTGLFKLNQSKVDSITVVSTDKKPVKSSINKGEILQENQKSNKNNAIVENSKNENLKRNNDLQTNIISAKNGSVVNNSNNQNSVIKKIENKNVSTNKNQGNIIFSNKNNTIVGSQNNYNEISVSKKNKNFDVKSSSNTTLVSFEERTKKENLNKFSQKTKKQKTSQEKNQNILDSTTENGIADNSENRSTKQKRSKKLVSNINKSLSSNQFLEVLAQNNKKESDNSSINLDKNTKEKSVNIIDVNSNYSIANATNATNATNAIAILPEIITKDSTIVALVEENPLEKILKEKENKDKEEKKIAQNTQKWKVKPNVAPLFMNATKGSPIDDQFADNAKTYENSLSVGLGVDYAVSKKLSIRTGINKFDYSYNTNDIVYYADFAAKSTNSVSNLKTINVASDAKNMIIEDKKISKSPEIALQTKEEGLLNQKTGYLEIPVEISYKLLDRKFGIQVITGFSSLLLNKNEVTVVSSGLTAVVGEANNLNKLHFSTNIGLGFKYSFWKSFEANFEPTFKYQLNTYNTNSGGFKPYLIGLYSGISFKF
jgi:hypothetical protein